MAQFNTLNLAEIYNAADTARLRKLQADSVEKEIRDSEALKGAYAIGEDGTLDEKTTLSNLYRVNPMKAYEFKSGIEKSKADGRKAMLDSKTATAKYFRDRLATVQDQAGYDAVYQEAMQIDPSLVQGAPQQFDPKWVQSQVMTADKYLEQMTPRYERVDLGGKVQIVDTNPYTNPEYKNQSFEKTPSPQGKLAAVQEYEYAVSQGYKGTFDQYQTTQKKAGATSVNVNTGELQLGSSGSNKVDESILNNTSKIARLTSIESSFKPEFANIGNRAKMGVLATASKFGKKLDPKDEKALSEYSEWKRTSLTNLNSTIKELTGAAMGVQEAERIIASLPNPGQGMFDGDDAVTFNAKLNGAIKEVKNAIARDAYIKRNGLTMNDVPLERMPTLMNERGQSLERELIAADPGLAKDKNALRRRVKSRLASEFGLVEEF